MNKIIANVIWKICGLGPRIGNFVMDLIGYDRYKWVMDNQTIHKKED